MSTVTDRGWVATAKLLHYGVKGMKWGVRNAARSGIAAGRQEIQTRRAAAKAHDVTVSQKGKKKLRATGGAGHPASAEAVRVKSLGQVARKSGFQALSNEELQAYNNRLNLEANAKRLDYQNKPAAKRFVASLLGQTGKNAAQQAANEVASR